MFKYDLMGYAAACAYGFLINSKVVMLPTLNFLISKQAEYACRIKEPSFSIPVDGCHQGKLLEIQVYLFFVLNQIYSMTHKFYKIIFKNNFSHNY